jgi:hypothetical protein
MIVLRLLFAIMLAGTAMAVPVQLVDGNGNPVSLDGELRTSAGNFLVRRGLADVAIAEGGTIDVQLAITGWWALPATVTASGAHLRVWPTGTIKGVSVGAKDITAPSSFLAVVEVPPQPIGDAAIPRGTKFDCTVGSEGRFQCELPATTLDLVFRSKGLTPHYRWRVDVHPDRPTDIGTVTWNAGGSLVVWLDRESMLGAQKGATAKLTRMVAGDPSVTAARLSAPVAEAKFDRRGYAQLAPVGAGSYALEIVAPGFARKLLSPIEIYDASESVLRKPITLERPITIGLTISPSQDAAGQRWEVMINRLPDSGMPMTAKSKSTRANESGRVTLEDESAGRYSVSVADSNGDRVFFKEFAVTGPADAEQTIAIEQHTVTGSVTLGGAPLPAEVIFGTRDGAERVTLRANEDGEFRGLLPRLGSWPIEIRDDERQVSASLFVTVSQDEELTIRLQDGRLSGTVVDADGNPVPNAEVIVATASLGRTHIADNEGRFRIRGVEGTVALSARSPVTADESSVVKIDVNAGQNNADIKLQLNSRRSIKGRVVSDGQPVPGASVAAYPSAGGRVMRATTDLEGKFEFALPDEQVASFLVAAAGRSLSAFQAPITREPITLTLDPVGGDVVIHYPPAASRVTIYQNGVQLGMYELSAWSEAHGKAFVTGSDTLSVPSLARGPLRACAQVAGQPEYCKDALIVPRGATTIDLRVTK